MDNVLLLIWQILNKTAILGLGDFFTILKALLFNARVIDNNVPTKKRD